MVKFFLLMIFLPLPFANCRAQDTVQQKNRLSDSVLERFYVLKANPEIKEGPFTVFLNRRILIVRGKYHNDQKAGVWQFFDFNGHLNEKYNYDTKKLTFEAPLYESPDFSYLFDDTLKIGDRLTRPVKIGGIFYGFLPYLNLFRLPFDTFNIDMDSFGADIELLISPLGQLADYNVRVKSEDFDYDHTFNLDVKLFSPEDRSFIPATRNGVQVISRIIIKCYVTASGGLDFY